MTEWQTVGDLNHLADRLAVFAVPIASGQPGGRIIAARNDRDLRDALFGTITETILPRRLKFTTDDGDCVAVDVSQRKIIGLAQATVQGHLSLDQSLIGIAFAPVTDQIIASLATLFDAFTDRQTRLMVQSLRMPTPPDSALTGIPVTALTARPSRPEGTVQLARFLDTLDQNAMTLLHIDREEIVQMQGDEAALAGLLDLSRTIWADSADAPSDSDEAQFIALESGPTEDGEHATVLAKAGDMRLMLSVTGGSAVDLTEHWLSCGR